MPGVRSSGAELAGSAVAGMVGGHNVTIRQLADALVELAVLVLLLLALSAAVVFGDAVLNGRPT